MSGTHATTPWMPWFAWRPVNTLTHGWRWLCWIERKRIMCNTEGDIRLVGWSFWLYRKPTPALASHHHSGADRE